MTFALILLILTSLTGLLTLFDLLIWSKKPRKGIVNTIVKEGRSYFIVFLSVFLLRSFFYEPFRIPTGSLEPTLNVGDFILVNKFAYGFRFPVIEKEVIPFGLPKHGDIAIFRWPPDPSFDYIKRVIGLPHDVIAYHNKQLTVNGKAFPLTYIEDTIDESSDRHVAKYEEDYFGVKHFVYLNPDMPAFDFEVTVPDNQYFMMGDNRDDSADSRFFGFVDESYLRGRGDLIWMSFDGKKDWLRLNRIGKIIH